MGLSFSWVNSVFGHFRDWGIAGLYDRREDNGNLKADEWFSPISARCWSDSPQSYGYPRPTWTQELLVKVMAMLTGCSSASGP